MDRHSKFEDGKDAWREAEETIARAQAASESGLPRPREVILSPVLDPDIHFGSPHARQFPCVRRKTGGNRHHTHAIISFETEVRGPVLLGAGRYRGYGLCRPWDNDGGGATE